VSDVKHAPVDQWYMHWVYAGNGYCFKLVAWGGQGKITLAGFKSMVRKLFEGFEVIDRDKIAHSAGIQPAGNYESDLFGFRVELEGTPWKKWENLASEFRFAEFGALLGDTAALGVIPVQLGGFEPHPDGLAQALLSRMDIPFPDPRVRQVGNVKAGAFRGRSFEYEAKVESGPRFVYRLRVLEGHGRAYLLAAWMEKGTGEVRALAEALDRIRFDSRVAEPLDPDRMDGRAKRTHGFVFNDLGRFHYGAKDYAGSIEAFRKAFSFEKNDPVVLANAVNTCLETGRLEKAFALLDPHIKAFPNNGRLNLYHARLLAQLGEPGEALGVYASVFGKGHRDDRAFAEYALLLDESKGKEASEAAVESYLRAQESISIRVLMAQLHFRWGEKDRAITLLTKLQEGRPPSTEILFPLIAYTYENEMYLRSIGHCETLLKKGYDAAAVHYFKGRGEYALKWYRRAKASFEKAKKKDPADEDARRYLELTSAMLGEGSNSSIKAPIEPVAVPPELLAAGGKAPFDASEYGAHYVRKITAIAYERGKDYRVTTHRLVRITGKSGVGEFSSFQFPFDPLGERIYLNSLRILDERGAVVSVGKVEDAYVIDDPAGVASQRKILHIPVPGLMPGVTVDITVTHQTVDPPELMRFLSYSLSSKVPAAMSALVFLGDEKAVLVRASPSVEARRIGKSTAWILEDPPVFRVEPNQPDYRDFLPTVWLNGASRSWDGEVNEYLRSIAAPLKGDPVLETAAEEATGGAASDEAKGRAVVRWVQKTLTYKAVAFGRRASVPRDASEILRTRYGDCKDHALLLHLLLEKAGIASSLVLANLGGPVRADLPSIDQFDHMVVMVEGGGERRFIDCTDKGSELWAAPPAVLRGAEVLILDPKSPRLETVPVVERGTDRVRSSRVVRIEEGGAVTVTETLTVHGAFASTLRAYLKASEPTRRMAALQGDVFSSVPGAVLEALEVDHLGAPERPVGLRMRYRVRGLFRETGGKLVGRLPTVWERDYLALQPVGERRNPVRFTSDILFESVVTLTIPAGFQPVDFGTPESKGTFPAPWSVIRSRAGDKLTVNFRLARPSGRHPASAYTKFVDAIEKGLDALAGTVVLAKK
jgi:tetratricopeptide (TPR) repeat protein